MSKTWSKINQIIHDLDKAQEKVLDKAAVHLRSKIREKIKKRRIVSLPGSPPSSHTGNLRKGIKFTREPGKRLVGLGKPASHGHLLELGTGPRVVKNYRGTGKSVMIGPSLPRPFLLPTFEEQADTVEKILSETWI